MAPIDRRKRRIDERALDLGGGVTVPPGGGGAGAPPAIPAGGAPQNLHLGDPFLIFSAVTPSAGVNAYWTPPPGSRDPDSYIVQWATDSSFTAPVSRVTARGQTSIVLDGLPVATTIYVRVAARFTMVQGTWSSTVSATTPSDTTPPAAPTSFGYTWSGLTGDLTITWTNPTSANFRDVRVRIYTHNGGTLLREVYAAGGLYVWTLGQHHADTSGVYDPSVYVVLTARSWGGVFSATDLTGSPTLAAPATPAGLATSWDGDLSAGLAAADLLVTWTRSNAVADYEVRITGTSAVVRRVGLTDRYLYTFDQNAAENSGTAQATLTVAVYGVDALGQISALGASTSALNGPPPAAVLAAVFAGSSSVGLTITPSTAKDLLDYRVRVYKTALLVDTLYVTSVRPTITIEDGDGSYQFDVSARDMFEQIGTASSLSSAVDLMDWDTFIDNLRAGAIYSDQIATSPETLFDAYTDDNRSSGGVSYALSATWTHWIRFERAERDRYRTITLAMAPAGGTTNWYIRTSEDGATWSYFAGPVTSSRILTAVANAAAAQAAAVSAATLGSSSASRVDLPAITSARYVEVWFRNTTHSTRVDEFYPRRLVQSDDLEAEAIKAVNIASNAILANHISATAIDGFVITGATIQTAASGERVVLDSTGLKTYDSAGVVQVEATTATDGKLTAGGGTVTLDAGGILVREAGEATAGDPNRAYNIGPSTGDPTSQIYSVVSPDTQTAATYLYALPVDAAGGTVHYDTDVYIVAEADADNGASPRVILRADHGEIDPGEIILQADPWLATIKAHVATTGGLNVGYSSAGVSGGHARISGGLNVGSATGAGAGEIRLSGALIVGAWAPASWTPVLQGTSTAGTFTYTRRVARYTLLSANVVLCQFEILVASVSVSATGNLVMTGLPFTAKNTTNYQQSGYLSQWDSLNVTAGYIPSINIRPNTTIVDFVQSGDNVASAAVPASTVVGGFFVRGAIIYEIEI